MSRTAYYRENQFDINDDALTIPQIKESLVEFFPELEKATHRVEGDNIYFEVQAGTKGI